MSAGVPLSFIGTSIQQVTYRGFQTQSRDFSVYDSHQVVDGRDVGNPMLDIEDIDSLHSPYAAYAL